MKIKKRLLPLIAVTAFFVSSVAALAGNGNGNNGSGNGNGGSGVESPEPAAVVTFLALAGVALTLRRKFSKRA